MMMTHEPLGFEWLRLRIIKLIYDSFSLFMLRDESWQQPLFASLNPKSDDSILNFGRDSASIAVSLARRFPGVNTVGADPNRKAVEKARRRIARRQISNVAVVEAAAQGRLPFGTCSFDKVVCLLTFHDVPPTVKVELAKEMLRVLRHGGTLYVADYDKPATLGESGVLKLARYISGPTAAEPHIDGSWTGFLAKAGFTGVRRQSSQSISVGRISVVKARKR